MLTNIYKWIFCFLVPTYKTYKSIIQKEKDETKLLKLWVCIISYLFLESIADYILFWFFYYYELKVLLLLYITLPQSEGSTVIYDNVFFPFLKENEEYIDCLSLKLPYLVKSVEAKFAKSCRAALNTIAGRVLNKFQKINSTIADSQGKPLKGNFEYETKDLANSDPKKTVTSQNDNLLNEEILSTKLNTAFEVSIDNPNNKDLYINETEKLDTPEKSESATPKKEQAKEVSANSNPEVEIENQN